MGRPGYAASETEKDRGKRILPVTEPIAERWGHLAAAAKPKGMTLAVVDGVIAATALHHDLTVVTRNTKDFAGLGVEIFNPWDDATQSN